MCSIGDRIKPKIRLAGSSEYIGYVHAFHPDGGNYVLIHFPGCTFGHDGRDSYGTIHGQEGSKEFYWLDITEFKVIESARKPNFIELMIE